MKLRAALMLSLGLLVSCAKPPKPIAAPPPPAPAPIAVKTPSPPPRLPGDWLDWPLVQGDWVYRADPRGSIALYGQAGADAVATLRCDRARQRIFLSLAGQIAAGQADRMIIRTSSTMRELAAANSGGVPNYIAVEFNPRDPILDAIAFSRGRFLLDAGGNARVFPPWPEVSRVIEDCR